MSFGVRVVFGLWLALTAPAAWAFEACVAPSECNDGNDCTTDGCVGGFCVHTPDVVACGPVHTFLLPAKKLKLHIPPSAPDRRGARMLTTEGALNKDNLPVPLSASDPVVKGGSVRIFTNTGDLFDHVYPLPWANSEISDPGGNHWDYFPFNVTDPLTNRGYQFKDSTGLHDTPIGVVKIIAGTTMKLKGKDQMTFTLATDPSPVNVVLTLGNYRYCFVMNGTGANGFRSGWTAGKIAWAKNVDAPTACPCNADADCDDGDGGTGPETCVAGFCVP